MIPLLALFYIRKNLLAACKESDQNRILITHGTDTMIEIGAFLAQYNLPKTIVITGAFLPDALKDSDADFNVGLAVGALKTITPVTNMEFILL